MTLQTGKGCKSCAVVGDGAVWGKIVWTLRNADRIHLRSLPLKWG